MKIFPKGRKIFKKKFRMRWGVFYGFVGTCLSGGAGLPRKASSVTLTTKHGFAVRGASPRRRGFLLTFPIPAELCFSVIGQRRECTVTASNNPPRAGVRPRKAGIRQSSRIRAHVQYAQNVDAEQCPAQTPPNALRCLARRSDPRRNGFA